MGRSAAVPDAARPVAARHRFDGREPAGSLRVVIGQSLARSVWPGQDPVGKPLALDLFEGITATVIGVVGDLHPMDPRTPARPVAYLSDAQFPSDTRDLIVRIAADRFTTFLLSAFAALALLLGAVGVFGVFSGEMSGRRKEIAVRMALGANTSTLLAMTLRQALARAALGIVGGAMLALALARSMASLLFGVRATDPASFVLVAALVCGLAAIASLVPTVQLLRSSPLASLRGE